MYTGFLHLHRTLFYLLFILLVVSSVKFLIGWLSKKEFTGLDNKLSLFSLIGAHIQLVLGLALYFQSPIVEAGLQDVGAAMKDATLRYWTVEHISIMIIGIILITLARSIGKRGATGVKKHKKHALFLIPGFILILSRVPWDRII